MKVSDFYAQAPKRIGRGSILRADKSGECFIVACARQGSAHHGLVSLKTGLTFTACTLPVESSNFTLDELMPLLASTSHPDPAEWSLATLADAARDVS